LWRMLASALPLPRHLPLVSILRRQCVLPRSKVGFTPRAPVAGPGRGAPPRRAASFATAAAAAGSDRASIDSMAPLPLVVTFVTGNRNKLIEVRAILGVEHASKFSLDSKKVRIRIL